MVPRRDLPVKPVVVIKKSRAALLAEMQESQPSQAPAVIAAQSSEHKKHRWHEYQWMKIPLETRLSILSSLQSTPFPWRALMYELEAKHGLTHSQVTALAWSIMRCGFDDPYITGKKPLEELRAILETGKAKS
jgi:hypothetical protein